MCCSHHTYLCQVVIEVHISSTQVSPQQRSVSGEDGCNRQLSVSTQHQAEASQPLVKMGNNMWRVLRLGCKLQHVTSQL